MINLKKIQLQSLIYFILIVSPNYFISYISFYQILKKIDFKSKDILLKSF